MRIVSLLPSTTEILFQLGLGDHVVGVTFECDFPPAARSKRIVSTSALPAPTVENSLTPAEIDAVVKQRMAAGEDLYRLDRDALADLDPTLILTQDLCAVCAVDVSEVDDALAHLGCRAEVLTLDPMTLDQVIASVATVGAMTGTAAEADAIVEQCRARLAAVAAAVEGARRRPTLVLEWTDPAFTAGHWVPDMVSAAGGDALLGRPGEKSVGVEWSTITDCGAEVVLIAPCGFRLEGAATQGAPLLAAGVLPRGAEVWAVDADALVVRPSPRVVEGVELFASILHPDRLGTPDPATSRRLA
ncbi:MAG: ABC transporter substrate-binding protein [Ilumatobacteraceae bacterium]